MQEERTAAIVLYTRAYGESDKIVTLLTRDWGKITGIAKGAKRSRRRFVNVLEAFTHVQVRFRPSKVDDLAFIFGCDMIQSFRGPSRNLKCFALASYVVELMDVMITGREAGQEAYLLLLQGLSVIDQQAILPPLFLPAFELLLLSQTGYEPLPKWCQSCRAQLSEGNASLAFSPSLGGFLCACCQERGGAILMLASETLQLLHLPKNGGLEPFLMATVSPRASREMRTLVSRLLSRQLSRPLKSVAFLQQIGLRDGALVDVSQGE
jgi:DNA repair protein RecO (recombination protein O)